MTHDVSNTEDILDSRDVEARIEELESDREEFYDDEHAVREVGEFEDQDELDALRDFRKEAQGYCSDWDHGETLIRDSYFVEYAEQLADDIGAINRNATWPLTCIDWEQAANELKVDYTSAEFDGVEYWFR